MPSSSCCLPMTSNCNDVSLRNRPLGIDAKSPCVQLSWSSGASRRRLNWAPSLPPFFFLAMACRSKSDPRPHLSICLLLDIKEVSLKKKKKKTISGHVPGIKTNVLDALPGTRVLLSVFITPVLLLGAIIRKCLKCVTTSLNGRQETKNDSSHIRKFLFPGTKPIMIAVRRRLVRAPDWNAMAMLYKSSRASHRAP